ncbi:MAG: hypothetical protein J1G04_03705 [Clostridiales bacterium]|nr:hypothetical protein [Clostridiales bacterium]
MKLTFLGTSAAEGVPAVFCNCPTCTRAKEKGGKEIRTRSQILIDDDILFDFPMDTYMHMLRYKLDLSAISRVLITHAHMDHCYPQEFCMRGGPFAHELTREKIEIFCNSSVKDMFLSDSSREMREEVGKNIDLRVLHPYDRVEAPDLTIIALPAQHTVSEECLVYYVERGNIGAVLLNDTGPLDRRVYERLKDMGAKVDIAVLDCTYGAVKHGNGRHMGLYDAAEQAEIMRSVGLFNDGAHIVVTHLSHNTDLDYDGMQTKAGALGITVAYDGYTVERNR